MSALPMAGVMRAELRRAESRMAALQARNETLVAELEAVRVRLTGVEATNARLLSHAAAVEELKVQLDRAGRYSEVARTNE